MREDPGGRPSSSEEGAVGTAPNRCRVLHGRRLRDCRRGLRLSLGLHRLTPRI